ncbi:recombinase zinc beta ribbon domain-containing protein [Amaricoccus solimangrovi]|uniref:Recombinase zinc beta ribbon domain-containing protein n=1 Tax=Amaricoccus solimangrovi TaxID=2589815 RepID=A0A501W2Y9_9RHOB|nr:hypothetical protein FJM51_23445 [Amaricoccus solimangrovi]
MSRLNAPEDWITAEVPELRIIDEELWARARTRQAEAALPRRENGAEDPAENRGAALRRANRPRFLLSGLVTCGVCGGGMSMISATHIGCSSARNKGTCENRKTIARKNVEERVLGALATRLMDPDLFAVFCAEFTAETNRLRGAARERIEERKRELAKVNRDLERLVQAIVDGTPARTIHARIAALEARREELEAEQTRGETPPPLLHPAMAEIYRAKVGNLAAALTAPDSRVEATEILRGLIDAIELRSGAEGYEILLRGDLAGILTLASDTKKPGAVSGTGLSQLALVAGAGFEPAAFRL